MDSEDDNCRLPVVKYGMLESRRALKRRGFHPDVTLKKPREVEEETMEYLRSKVNIPGRSEYLASQSARLARESSHGYPGNLGGTIARRLTKGPWFVTARLAEKPAFKGAAAHPKDAVPASPASAPAISPAVAPEFESVTSHMYIGPKIIQDVFSDGHQTAMKLSLTSSKMFKLVSDSVSRWDFCAMNYIVQVPSSVMVVMVPQHTVADILDAQKKYGLEVNSPEWTSKRQELEAMKDFDSYKLQSIEIEHKFFEWARTWREECLRTAGPYWATNDQSIDPRTTRRARDWWGENRNGINVMGSLKPMDKMWLVNQFEGNADKLHKIPLSLEMDSLFKLMAELYRVRSHVEVLHLHDVPLLDRRMLAIMLRGLPHLTMVGVYNCPLIHFGDVIPILDLIYEINKDRKERGVPEIKGFDFFPFFNTGMPFEHQNAATYGISWKPIAIDTAQRGFYAIILKAVMKAKGMGLDLLFSPGHAFMSYLAKVPNLPLGVYSFLDAIYRYMAVERGNPNRCNLKLQAIYDMLKPIRVALELDAGGDWPKFYIREMAKTFMCCCSCGYETFKEFFPAGSKRRVERHKRICCGCLLQRALDDEEDHWKARKKDLLDKLCPDWEPDHFNEDAPIFVGGAGLIRLESTETVRPGQVFPFQIVNGLLRVTPYYQPLLRDAKAVFDSLKTLPSLEDMATGTEAGRRWSDAITSAIKEDVHRLGILKLKSDYQKGSKKKGIPSYGPTREDGGAPDHDDEVQPSITNRNGKFFDHRDALKMAIWMKQKGW